MAGIYNFESEAALKVLLHACRHPSSTVCGVFLGREAGDATSVQDCIPLFHSNTAIGPCAESALWQVVELAKQRALSLVGFYEAEPQVSALNEDAQSAPRAMAEKLVSNGCNKCNLFVMDNAKLGEFMDEKSGDMPFHVLGKTSAGKWSRSAGVGPSSLKCDNGLPAVLKRQLAAKVHFSLHDFDDHLDNLQRDWLNSKLEFL
eukprot:jgi/Ulvmu1/11249/UM073_0021.1